ncbi:MAG TPA: DNA polymerase III subunit alpha [Patescibacteria group bacterium]|nr:DNA polymerase III subunit alpha [Patescibacteria group bacterium]
MSNFVHLHVHSEFSLLDGLGKIDLLINKAKILGMEALAITDHGSMYGVLQFYKKAKAAGIKPILGVETYVAPRTMADKTPRIDTNPYHLVLLAKNNQGYQNLLKIVSASNIDGFYYKPRIDKKTLSKYTEGIIALSACLQGEPAQKILLRDLAGAEKAAQEYSEMFGKGNYYLEIQDHPNMEEQNRVNKEIIKIGRKLDIPLVLTNDVHYVDSKDQEAHEILLCVQTQKTIQDNDRMSMAFDDFSLKSESEIAMNFKEYPEALENTQKIANECNVELSLGEFILPKFAVPGKMTAEKYLEELCYENLPKKFGFTKDKPVKTDLAKEVLERLKYELSIIETTGYANYFLIVSEYVNWAKNQGILVGPGRGSATGSLVSYLIGITDVEPIKYNLLFERFLNPERISMPDIDIDFADDRRGEVIEHVTQKYGKNNVAQVVTFGTMAARASVRDTARALALPYSFADRLAKMIPAGMNLKTALEKVPELAEAYRQDGQAKKTLDLAQKLEGVSRHASVHAAGVVFADKALTEYVPLQLAPHGEISLLTQYSMYDLEEVGLVKMDFLGLSNLTVIQDAIKIIEKTKNKKNDIQNIPLDNPETFKLLAKGETTGVFQFESDGMKRYLKELEPTRLEDLIAMAALYRPGPIESIPHYINNKRHPGEVKYLHPDLKPILEPTYGTLVYQEQLFKIAQVMAGFTLGEADILRKAVGKKIKKLLDEQKSKFINGVIKKGFGKKLADRLWSFIEPFASYGFNKSHSAAYALIAYWTAYLKANFPSEFMAALLTSDKNNTDRVAIEIAECQRLGLAVLQPSVNESFENFTVLADGNIRFGLGAVKNIGPMPIEAIVEARKKGGAFKSVEDFCKRVDFMQVNKKVVESLVKSGAMDDLGERGSLLAGSEQILKYANNLQKTNRAGQVALFETTGPQVNFSESLNLPEIEPVGQRQKLSWEKELLGVYLSGHPLADFEQFLAQSATPISTLNNHHDGKRARIGGMITRIKKIITRNGEPMVFATLEDKTNFVEVLVFPKILAANSEIWREDNVVVVTGKINLKDNQLKILADSVQEVGEQMSLEDEPGLIKPEKEEVGVSILHLKIPKIGANKMLLSLKEILIKYPGETEVILLLPQNGGLKEVKIKTKIELTEDLLIELKNLLSESRVSVKQLKS